ncbi:SHUGOSHIN 2-like isoform X2 [Tripterygium wilfordii]|uniref:SHUGOSHIN 2-like isoform X2 n=1 Tax=Tripterygium wilfordii TaxID=458696 RepID=UPI0018F7EA8E|nr:SHUGOSHIN 2-like isoform X2 [Tripterygium wilfordii]
MDGDAVIGVENSGGVAGNNKKVDKMAAPRKRLADITNMLQQPKPAKLDAKKHSTSFDTKQYIDKLQKENMALIQALADRNKVIELSGIELQKLRINLQKVQQQNLQLAKANTQMLAELNSGKDRLKALQHQLGCKNGLLNAKKLEMEKAKTVTRQTSGSKSFRFYKVETIKHKEAWDSSQADKGDDDKPCGAKKRRQSKVQSLGNPTVKPVEDKDKVDNKRSSSRRQSARFKSQGKPSEDLFEVGDTKFPVSTLGNDSVVETSPASVSLSDKHEPDAKSLSPESEAQDSGRSSIERPSCQAAAKKVHSSRETSLKVEAKDKVDHKRRSSRRQLARFKSQGEPPEDEFEIDDTKFPVSTLGDDLVIESSPSSVTVAAKDEPTADHSSPEGEAQEFGRRSIGRLSRQAAKKVHSYKEISLKVKMRRTD